ncbi:MAG: cyclic nucleotide-binding domain-containing protein [Rhodanobacteraceae bacterium]|nr:cyclic nucleotide-binding domain-containing protein [Rhodanobacteraceae bacterium]MBP9154240.1 cyclic nucleotide-binding domain-containing protein [Xanthomonadales bacterium]HQW80357.1 cyclic nucleotide-binding domain-containing protein [Pseudomonadota bacterium]
MAVDAAVLAKLYPLDKLGSECIEQLAKEVEQIEVGKGSVLFRAGDTDEHTIYVAAGVVRGDYPDGKNKSTDGNSLQGRYPLGDLQPRRFTATVESLTATLLKLDRRYAEKVMVFDQLTKGSGFQHYAQDPGGNRWVFRLLHNRALHKMPTGAVERLFQRLVEVIAVKDQIIVREGDEADYFYVIKEGSAQVSKQIDGHESVVAYLVRGDTFGEDALLTKSVRNATVSMKTDGKLMRLSTKDFAEILTPPVVDWVNPAKASELSQAGAQILDVRTREEFDEAAIKGALNIPLLSLRDRIDELDRTRSIIVYCNTGERSAAATFILGKVGFTAFALQGGLAAMMKMRT